MVVGTRGHDDDNHNDRNPSHYGGHDDRHIVCDAFGDREVDDDDDDKVMMMVMVTLAMNHHDHYNIFAIMIVMLMVFIIMIILPITDFRSIVYCAIAWLTVVLDVVRIL